MTTVTMPFEDVQEIIKCPLCLEFFSDPRLLPCVHTFCLKCISAWTDGKRPTDSVDCPLCRKKFSIPNKGISDLPKNIFIGKLLTVEASSCGLGGVYCDWCQTGTLAAATDKLAKVRCIECQQKLCEVCKTAHAKIEATHHHQFVTLGQEVEGKLTESIASKCDEHPDKDLEIYCFDCEENLCIACFFTQHHGHKSGDVKKVADECRSKINSFVFALNEDVRLLTASMNQLQHCRQEVLNKFSGIELEVNAKADQLIATIERCRRELLCECKQLKDERLRTIDHELGEVTQNKAITESLVEFYEELQEKGSNSDITRETKSLPSRAGILGKFRRDETMTVEEDVVIFAPAASTLSTNNCIGSITVSSASNSGILAVPSSLAYSIPHNGDGVSAVTSLNGQLFVAYGDNDRSQIAVYDTSTFQLLRYLDVPCVGQVFGMATCALNNCLYISAYDHDAVYRINLKPTPDSNMKTTWWSVAPGPVGLSVNRLRNVYVATESLKIEEYTPSGLLKRELPLGYVVWQAVEQVAGALVVSRWDAKHCVSLLSVDGNILHSYNGTKDDAKPGQMNFPRSLAVDRNNCVFVADRDNNRIVVLNPTLSEARSLSLPLNFTEPINRPTALCLDESRDRLYIGEYGGQRRLLVFDIINISTASAPSKRLQL